MTFPDISQNRTFNLKDVNDATIASRRRLSAFQPGQITAQERETTLMLPASCSTFALTPNDSLGDDPPMSFGELSYQLNMRHHEQNMEGKSVSQGNDTSRFTQDKASATETERTISADSQCTDQPSATRRRSTTIRLTVNGNPGEVFLASAGTVQALRNAFENSQSGPGIKTNRVRTNIAAEVLTGYLTQNDLDSVRKLLDVDTNELANDLSQRAARDR